MTIVVGSATTEKLEIVLDAAVATNELEVTVSYATQTTTTFVMDAQKSSTNGTTDQTILSATGDATKRLGVSNITVYNADTASAVFTIKYDDGGTEHIIMSSEIAPGATWRWSDTGFNITPKARAQKVVNLAADLTTTSTTFVDVDAGAPLGTELEIDLTTNGGDVALYFIGCARNTSPSNGLYFDFYEANVLAARFGGAEGIQGYFGYYTTIAFVPCAVTYLVQNLAPATYKFKVQWKVAPGGTSRLFAGAGTAYGDIYPIFWAQEI